MYSSKTKCQVCSNNKFREVIVEHSLKTRDVNRRELNIQNLPVEQCVVCGEKSLTEKSELIIESLKEMIQKQLNDSAAEERAEIVEKREKTIIKKISGLFK